MSRDQVTVALDGRGAERGPEVIVAGARAAAADGIGVRVFGDPAALAELDGVDGVELARRRRARSPTTTTRVGAFAREPRRLDRAGRRATSPRAARTRSPAPAPTGATMTAALFALRRTARSAPPGARRPARRARAAGRADAAPRRRRQRRGPARRPGPVRLPRRRLQRGRARGRSARGSRCSRSARSRRRARRDVRRGPREARRARERHRLPRATSRAATCSAGAADVIVTDGFTGNVALKTIEGTARAVADAVRDGGALRPDRGGGRRCCCARRSAGCAARWTRTAPAARSCSACAASRSSATAAPGPDGIANAIRLAARAVESARSSAPPSCCERSGGDPGARCVIVKEGE